MAIARSRYQGPCGELKVRLSISASDPRAAVVLSKDYIDELKLDNKRDFL